MLAALLLGSVPAGVVHAQEDTVLAEAAVQLYIQNGPSAIVAALVYDGTLLLPVHQFLQMGEYHVAAFDLRDSLVVRAGMDRVGNAAYLGTGHFELVDAAGAIARQWSTPLAVYYPINRRFVFPLENLAPGAYTVRVRAEAVRPDIEEGRVLPAASAMDSVAVIVG